MDQRATILPATRFLRQNGSFGLDIDSSKDKTTELIWKLGSEGREPGRLKE